MNKFFKKSKPISIFKIINLINCEKNKIVESKINDIKPLDVAKKYEISFLNSSKYLSLLKKTEAKFIICKNEHKNFLPKSSIPLTVKNVHLAVSQISNYFYPSSSLDLMDKNLKSPNIKGKFKNVLFGKNVLIGKNVKIGSKSSIGHNTIIESNVEIGKNSIIGSNVIIRNSLIGSNVIILDGSIIGKKGFGFLPSAKKNLRYPHIGLVIIGDNVEIGCNNTIDRGSLSNTIIGDNTFLDNQVHIAHNVQIGKNCIIAGQVGFAGSSIIGNNVMIGGQAGISGHLKIGNNVQIAGGSGVIKDIPDNSKVMGYPAKDIRKFLKDNFN